MRGQRYIFSPFFISEIWGWILSLSLPHLIYGLNNAYRCLTLLTPASCPHFFFQERDNDKRLGERRKRLMQRGNETFFLRDSFFSAHCVALDFFPPPALLIISDSSPQQTSFFLFHCGSEGERNKREKRESSKAFVVRLLRSSSFSALTLFFVLLSHLSPKSLCYLFFLEEEREVN